MCKRYGHTFELLESSGLLLRQSRSNDAVHATGKVGRGSWCSRMGSEENVPTLHQASIENQDVQLRGDASNLEAGWLPSTAEQQNTLHVEQARSSLIRAAVRAESATAIGSDTRGHLEAQIDDMSLPTNTPLATHTCPHTPRGACTTPIQKKQLRHQEQRQQPRQPQNEQERSVTEMLAEMALQDMRRRKSSEFESGWMRVAALEKQLHEIQVDFDGQLRAVNRLLKESENRFQDKGLEFQRLQANIAELQNRERNFDNRLACKDDEILLLKAQLRDARCNGSDSVCVICLDAAATHVVVPCGHLALCATCVTAFEAASPAGSCPLCGQVRERIVKMFRPGTHECEG